MPLQTYSFRTTAGVVASSSGLGWCPFEFRARDLHIDNLGTVPIWIKLDSSSTGSTGDFLVHSCTGYNWADLSLGDKLTVRQVTIFATSTAASGFDLRAIG